MPVPSGIPRTRSRRRRSKSSQKSESTPTIGIKSTGTNKEQEKISSFKLKVPRPQGLQKVTTLNSLMEVAVRGSKLILRSNEDPCKDCREKALKQPTVGSFKITAGHRRSRSSINSRDLRKDRLHSGISFETPPVKYASTISSLESEKSVKFLKVCRKSGNTNGRDKVKDAKVKQVKLPILKPSKKSCKLSKVLSTLPMESNDRLVHDWIENSSISSSFRGSEKTITSESELTKTTSQHFASSPSSIVASSKKVAFS